MAATNVKGLRELNRLLAATDKEAKRALTAELKKVAEPIRGDAESLAASSVTRIGPRWSRMRVGSTQRLVYVAPKERGIKTRGHDPRRRPKFADLLEARAMTPALNRNRANIEAGVEHVFDVIAHDWNRHR